MDLYIYMYTNPFFVMTFLALLVIVRTLFVKPLPLPVYGDLFIFFIFFIFKINPQSTGHSSDSHADPKPHDGQLGHEATHGYPSTEGTVSQLPPPHSGG